MRRGRSGERPPVLVEARTTVVTVTLNPALDVSMSIDTLVPDRKLRAHDVRREAGGGGATSARPPSARRPQHLVRGDRRRHRRRTADVDASRRPRRHGVHDRRNHQGIGRDHRNEHRAPVPSVGARAERGPARRAAAHPAGDQFIFVDCRVLGQRAPRPAERLLRASVGGSGSGRHRDRRHCGRRAGRRRRECRSGRGGGEAVAA